VQPGKDVYVLAHCNWPKSLGMSEGVEHLGFDVRQGSNEAMRRMSHLGGSALPLGWE
jgi:hypothetical protein